ncbi:MAG TPA: DUF1549 and DUF1553 domain-containing protein [Bryobacteraceae bacterium]|nr:DUF1549 and DUF1553 domain-containing protein [Bryobacteraceae bacterium]
MWIRKRTAPLAVLLAALTLNGQEPKPQAALWSLAPVLRPDVPTSDRNPIDILAARKLQQKGLRPAPRADKAALIRRLYLDLTGLPPGPAEVDAFVTSAAPDAYITLVDKLLNDPQHGVRYARHWLDVLGYADVDSGMLAEPGIHLWRDWVIQALNRDVPYDQFVRAHIAGDLSAKPEDIFATGFLSRAAHSAADGNEDIAFAAVESVSSAFLGMTTGCAKCHDHMYDPISQRDYYAMKALFDPLLPDKRLLASAGEILRQPDVLAKWKAAQDAIQAQMDVITRPYEKQIFEERMTFLPPEVAAVFRKDPKTRTADEKKVAADYETVVTPDARKFRDVMKPEETVRYEAIRKGLTELRRDPPVLPSFWSVRADVERAGRKNHIYLGGDRKKKGDEVQPGFPFAPKNVAFKGDRRQVFLDWLTAPENPLFARVAVNRLWQWHFGEGIVATPSDFGRTGQMPVNPELLEWLAAEFKAQGYSMKAMHRLIVTSDLYQQNSAVTADLEAANRAIDPQNKLLWKYPLRRLEAEAIRDSLLRVAGTLDASIGGRSFRGEDIMERRVMSAARTGNYDTRVNRRGIYMGRGSDVSMNMMPAYLSLFDAEDGHVSCARRERSITAPQVLFLLNGELAQDASKKLAKRLESEAAASPAAKVEYGYKLVLARPPTAIERDHALSYVQAGGSARLEGFSWMLLNLSEFVFLP